MSEWPCLEIQKKPMWKLEFISMQIAEFKELFELLKTNLLKYSSII